MIRTAALLIAGMAFLTVGCHKAADPTGKWTGKINFSEADQKQNPKIAATLAAMIGTLELKPDKTFTMNMIVASEGTWTNDNGEVSLTTTKLMGRVQTDTKAATHVLTESADGNTLTSTDSTGSSASTDVFTRSPR